MSKRLTFRQRDNYRDQKRRWKYLDALRYMHAVQQSGLGSDWGNRQMKRTLRAKVRTVFGL